jgi:uncharacterized membrane protein
LKQPARIIESKDMMKFKASLLAGAVIVAVTALPITLASATPQLDPTVAQTDTLSDVEKAWWHHRHWHHWHHWHHRHW